MRDRSPIASKQSTWVRTVFRSGSDTPPALRHPTLQPPTFDTEALGADVDWMASSQTEPPPPLPSERSRRRSSLFIAAFVGLQFLAPLTYLVREDASDERFTWRSLTTPQPPACEALATLRRVDGVEETRQLESLLHEDWVEYVYRGRRVVLDAFLMKQCEGEGVMQVELVTDCDEDHRAFTLRCGTELPQETTRTASR
jgi:hypothetical protein